MILFVFEGEQREVQVFKAIERLYFRPGESIICSFNNNIYELYRQLQELDGNGDIVSVLREINYGNHSSPFAKGSKSSDYSEIFLFFDYDFQNKNLTLAEMNDQIEEMLDMFSDETDNGKLYINYPMIESIRYTKKLPDSSFQSYTISREECQNKNFKSIAAGFSEYGNLDFILFPSNRELEENEVNKLKRNWEYLIDQNISKANFICTDNVGKPKTKDDTSQLNIFKAQLEKFISIKCVVAILCAFPIFIYDYFKN